MINEHGRPYTCENGSVDDALLTDCDYKDIVKVDKWLKDNIRKAQPGEECTERSSYGLKHLLEQTTGVYLTNNAFKDAMLLAGYRPIAPDEVNWHFPVVYLPDVLNNEGRFFQFMKYACGDVKGPLKDFVKDSLQDKDFPVFSDHSIIMEYLQSNGACDGAIEAFEELWKTFSKKYC